MLTQLITRISLMFHLFMCYIILLSPVHYLIKLYKMLMYYVLLTISLVLDMAVDIRKMLEGATLERNVSKKLAWHKATADHIMQYRTYLHNVWEDVNLPYCSLLCRDVTCTDPEHLSALNTYASYITTVSKLHMNTFLAQKKEPLAVIFPSSWVELLCNTPKDKSLFWHHIWVDCSRPRSGYITDIMRSTMTAYHRAIRHIKRNQIDYN